MDRLDDWLAERALLDLAPPKVFVDGAAAAEHGAVEILERDDARLLSHVADNEVYEARFWLRDGRLEWSCSCGEAEVHPCAHLVASAIASWPGEPRMTGGVI